MRSTSRLSDLRRWWRLALLAAVFVACGQPVAAPTSTSAPPTATAVSPATATARPTARPEPVEGAVSSATPLVFEADDATPPPPPPTIDAGNDQSEVEALFPSPAYGIHLSQWWHLDALERDLVLTQDMGFGWVKQRFPWREIEGAEKGQYDWYRPDEIVAAAERAGLNLLVRIDSQPLWSVISLPDEQITSSQPPVDLADLGDFCHALAERYNGRIAAYQVWNEPNLSREWGNRAPDPAEYTEMLAVCYEGIKTADPGAIVISAGLAPTGTQPPLAMPDDAFLQGMYDAGAADYFDVLGLNAPGYKAPPDASPQEGETVEGYGGHRWNVFRHVEEMRDLMVANGDAEKQVAILEMGWMIEQAFHPDYTWHGVTEEQQAEYLVGAYEYARQHWRPWIGLMTAIYIADRDWQPETHEQYWWSIVLPDGTHRPAFAALQQMDK